jgi:hypothetical protein
MAIGVGIKYPLFLSFVNETGDFSTEFRKNIQISSLIKFRLVGADSFHAGRRTDGQTDRRIDRQIDLSKLKFAKVPKVSQSINLSIRNAVFAFVILLLKSIMKQFTTVKRN